MAKPKFYDQSMVFNLDWTRYYRSINQNEHGHQYRVVESKGNDPIVSEESYLSKELCYDMCVEEWWKTKAFSTAL